jgi:aminoglycoside 3-N-acetyltransferase
LTRLHACAHDIDRARGVNQGTKHPSPPAWRKAVKARIKGLQSFYAKTFRAYGPADLLASLQRLGVQRGEAVMLHSGFSNASGFRGSVEDLIATFRQAVGPEGHLLMVSLPYRDSTLAYLQRGKVFDVRRTPSMMGMVSETFRRQGDVRRSLSPTHPMLVAGPRADWFVANHEQCVHPCGWDTPFHRLAQVGGRCVFFNVPFATMTFFHHLEHGVAHRLAFPLYTPETFDAAVIDHGGAAMTVKAHAYHPEAMARRRFGRLEAALRAEGVIQTVKVGASVLETAQVGDVWAVTQVMAERDALFYDTGAVPTSSD